MALNMSSSALGLFPGAKLTGLNVLQEVRSSLWPICFLCTLRLTVTSFGATLDMGGWLDLTQQGLSPCKKRQALLGVLTHIG